MQDRTRKALDILFVAAFLSLSITVCRQVEAKSPNDKEPLRVAVVTGGHSYNVPGFHDLFAQLEGIKPYIQHLDDFASSPKEVRAAYDAIVFYIMPIEGPTDEGLEWYQGKPLAALSQVGEAAQGIVLLHHSLCAYREWPVWRELTGTDRNAPFDYAIGEKIQVEIADADHPITKGISNFEIVDETYKMPDADPGSEVLLTTKHPKSMHTIGWTRKYKKARIFCLQLGHDNRAWENPSFQRLMERGIAWTAAGK